MVETDINIDEIKEYGWRKFSAMNDPMGHIPKDIQKKFITYINTVPSKKDKALFYLLFYTGKRIGEILNLRVNNIRWSEDGKIKGYVIFRILKKKRKHYQFFPLAPFLEQVLKEYLDTTILSPQMYLFPGKKSDTHLTVRWIRYKTVKFFHNIGVDMIGTKIPHPHHFRHTLAINIIETTGNPKDVQEILQHSSLAVTETYIKYNREMQEKLLHRVYSSLDKLNSNLEKREAKTSENASEGTGK